MVVATQTATYLDETAGVLAAAYGVAVDDELNARLAALYEGDSTVQSEAAWREIRQLLWDRMEPAKWPLSRFNEPKFTAAEVVEIRERYAAGDVTQQQVADAFDCSQSTVSEIVRGVSYVDAGGPIQPSTKNYLNYRGKRSA